MAEGMEKAGEVRELQMTVDRLEDEVSRLTRTVGILRAIKFGNLERAIREAVDRELAKQMEAFHG